MHRVLKARVGPPRVKTRVFSAGSLDWHPPLTCWVVNKGGV